MSMMNRHARRAAAKRKTVTAVKNDDLPSIDLPRVATAVRKLISATTPAAGMDCCLYAQIGQYLLQRLGVTTEIALGYAAWRVGDGDGDVIAHHPIVCGEPLSGMWGAYHAWIEADGRIIDFSTHTLALKCALLDAQDGGQTNADWCPKYLAVEKRRVASSIGQVTQARHAGGFYYERVPSLEARFRADPQPQDDALMVSAWVTYQNPDIVVTGPTSFTYEQETQP